jgi:hypothetical protein
MEVVRLSVIEEQINRHPQLRPSNTRQRNACWFHMDSPITFDLREEMALASYDYRYERVYPIGVRSLNQWIAQFRETYGQDPIAVEYMGSDSLLRRLGLSGINVNWTLDYEEGLYDMGDGRYEINIDMENLSAFKPYFKDALTMIGTDKVDLVISKGEGALSTFLVNLDADKYWWRTFANLLAPGGLALIQWRISLPNPRVAFNYLNEVSRNMEGWGTLNYAELPAVYFVMSMSNYSAQDLGVFF